jgi:hypothetical protein
MKLGKLFFSGDGRERKIPPKRGGGGGMGIGMGIGIGSIAAAFADSAVSGTNTAQAAIATIATRGQVKSFHGRTPMPMSISILHLCPMKMMTMK